VWLLQFSHTQVLLLMWRCRLTEKLLLPEHTWSGAENQFALARYNSNGALDSSFGNSGIVSSSFSTNNAIARTMKIQSDGKIVVAGHIYTLNNDFDEFAIARYNTDGSPDATFGNTGQVMTSFGIGTRNWINSIELQNDGKIVAGGFSSNSFALARYESNGTLDISFGTGGLVTTAIPNTTQGLINAVTIHQPDGSIYGGGFSVDPLSNFTIAKYDSSGNLDTTFGTNGILVSPISTQQDGINDILLQADNKLLVAGSSDEDSVLQFALARFDSLGNLDSTFGTNGVVKTLIDSDFNQIESIALQSDGKILATGIIGNYPYDIAVTRYSSGVLSTDEQVRSIENISIYPNPTTDKLFISFVPKNKETICMKLFDSQGRLLKEKSIPNLVVGEKCTEVFDLLVYSAGTYILGIGNKSLLQNHIIIKE